MGYAGMKLMLFFEVYSVASVHATNLNGCVTVPALHFFSRTVELPFKVTRSVLILAPQPVRVLLQLARVGPAGPVHAGGALLQVLERQDQGGLRTRVRLQVHHALPEELVSRATFLVLFHATFDLRYHSSFAIDPRYSTLIPTDPYVGRLGGEVMTEGDKKKLRNAYK